MNTIIKRNFSDIESYTEYRNVEDMYEFENGMDYMLVENHNALIFSQMIHDVRCGNNDVCSTTKAENNYEHHVNKKLTKIGFGKLYPSFCKEQAYEAFDVMYKLGRSSERIHKDKDYDEYDDDYNDYGEREYIDMERFNCFLSRLNDDNFNRISKCFFFVSDNLSVRTKTRLRTKINTQEETFDFEVKQYTRTQSNSPRSYVKSYISSGLQILPEEEPLKLEEEVKNEIEVKTKRSLSSSSSHTLTAISSWRTKMKHKKQKFKSFVSGMIRKKNKIGSDLHGSVEDESYKYP